MRTGPAVGRRALRVDPISGGDHTNPKELEKWCQQVNAMTPFRNSDLQKGKGGKTAGGKRPAVFSCRTSGAPGGPDGFITTKATDCPIRFKGLPGPQIGAPFMEQTTKKTDYKKPRSRITSGKRNAKGEKKRTLRLSSRSKGPAQKGGGDGHLRERMEGVQMKEGEHLLGLHSGTVGGVTGPSPRWPEHFMMAPPRRRPRGGLKRGSWLPRQTARLSAKGRLAVMERRLVIRGWLPPGAIGHGAPGTADSPPRGGGPETLARTPAASRHLGPRRPRSSLRRGPRLRRWFRSSGKYKGD